MNLDDRSSDDWGPLSGLPGNPLMWVLIASELIVFGAIFIAFGAVRLSEPQVFLQAQDHLNRFAGALNTMILLTSGFCAALALRACIDGKLITTRLWLLVSAILGVIFLGIKWMEYSEKFSQGITTDTNSFFMFYYLATGFHALHVVFGILILIVVGWKISIENVVTGTAFWHMIDLIWVLLFAIMYLMR